MGLISVSGGLISGTIGLKPDHVDLKSDLVGLKSGRTEIPILSGSYQDNLLGSTWILFQLLNS